ncbi:MAG: hypothetical protein ACK5OX_07780 [Desertimonas sp.]
MRGSDAPAPSAGVSSPATDDLLSTTVEGVRVVHDPRAHTTHILDAATAAIWDAARRSAGAAMTTEGLASIGISPEDAARARADLIRHGLLAPPTGLCREAGETAAPGDGIDPGSHRRRELDESDRIGQPAATGVRPESGAAAVVARRRAVDAHIELATDDHVVGESLISATRHLAASADATHRIEIAAGNGRDERTVYVDGQLVARSPTAAHAVADARAAMTQLAAEAARRRIVLHAGAVAAGDDAVVIVGPSGAGKSTLVAGLVRDGLSYLTDELVVIDPGSFEVAPYPKWIDLTGPSCRLLGLAPGASPGLATVPVASGVGPKVAVDPVEIGSVATTGRVAAVVVLDLEPPVGPGLVPLTPLAALVDVLESTFPTTMAWPGGLDAVAELVTAVPVAALHRTDPTAARRLVRDVLSRRRPGRRSGSA